MKVAELKNLVFGAFNVPVKDQRLLLTGRPLCGNYPITLNSAFLCLQYVCPIIIIIIIYR